MKIVPKLNLLGIIGPGLLVAATGVGAGDLAGSAFAGSKLGITIIWAVPLGAFFKFVLTEGMARYQLACGQSFLEGLITKFGSIVQVVFMFYLFLWSFWVGSALISACGVAGYSLFPVFPSPEEGKILIGAVHSLIGLILVWFGRYSFFEKVVSVLIGMMFLTIIIVSLLMQPDWNMIFRSIILPGIPEYINASGSDQSIEWTLGLMGGVGGTLTILSYGYWMNEKGRKGTGNLRLCRIDLLVSYLITALFGMAMIIIASQTNLDKESSTMIILNLANQIQGVIGEPWTSFFILGAWAAIFSSLLGVWQSVPYIFTDVWNLSKSKNGEINLNSEVVNTKSKPYRIYLVGISLIPMLGLTMEFVAVQKIYAVFGSMVIPLFAISLLFLNGKREWVGKDNTNRPFTVIILILIVLLFLVIGLLEFFPSG